MAKYENKFVVVEQEKDESSENSWKNFTTDDAVEKINKLGLEGWLVRSYTFNNSKFPITLTFLLVRKIDGGEQ